jgi:hypothetical protein
MWSDVEEQRPTGDPEVREGGLMELNILAKDYINLFISAMALITKIGLIFCVFIGKLWRDNAWKGVAVEWIFSHLLVGLAILFRNGRSVRRRVIVFWPRFLALVFCVVQSFVSFVAMYIACVLLSRQISMREAWMLSCGFAADMLASLSLVWIMANNLDTLTFECNWRICACDLYVFLEGRRRTWPFYRLHF